MPASNWSQWATFSKYKHHNTAKASIGITPSGDVSFASDLNAGKNSDKQITNYCGILSLLELCDDIIADREFDIEEDLPVGVTLRIPPFLKGHLQFSLKDDRKIALVRAHAESTIQRTKNYKIWLAAF